MGAGRYNRSIAIQKKTTTYNATGEPIDTWADAFTIWANIVTSGGGEFYAAQKVNASTQAVFRVRYTQQISVLNRIRYGALYFNILAINEVDAMRKELLLSAREVD